jgi:hypothetical protein
MPQVVKGYGRLCIALGCAAFVALIVTGVTSAHNQRKQAAPARAQATTGVAATHAGPATAAAGIADTQSVALDTPSLMFPPALNRAFANNQTSATPGSIVGPDIVWSQRNTTVNPSVQALAYAPDGQTVASAHADRTVNIWRATDGLLLHTFPRPGYSCGGSGTNGVAYAPDSQQLFVTDGCATRLINIADGTLVRQFSAVGQVAVSPDGQYLAASLGSRYSVRVVKLFRVSDGALLWSVTGGGGQIAFAPDGTLATVNRDGIEFWRLTDGVRTRLIPGSKGAIAFSPDSSLVAAAGAAGGEYPYDSTVEWYTVADGALVRQVTRTGSVGMLRFSPDGQYLLAGGYEPDFNVANSYGTSTNAIRIFRLSDGLTFKTYDLGTEYPGVGGLSLAPDGQHFAYGIAATTYLAQFPPPTPCTYSITPTSATFQRDGGTGTVAVNTQPGCAWTARARVDWISTNASGTGPGLATYNVAAYANAVAPGPPYYHHDVVIVADQTVAVHQNVAPSCSPCYYNITGYVQDASCLTAISGATITLTGGASATTQTDANGQFSFPQVPGGLGYTVTVTKDGYVFAPQNWTTNNLTANANAYFQATVNPNPNPFLRGHIKDASGAGLYGIELHLDGGAYPRTDYSYDNGVYAFNCLEAQHNYTLTPVSSTYNFLPPSRTFDNLTVGQQGLDFVALPKAVNISGHVTDALGGGLAGVTIMLGGAGQDSRTTDANGDYTFTNLAGGASYTLNAALVGYTFTPATQTINNMSGDMIEDFAVAPNAPGQVLISEFRTRGPAGSTDEFVELANNTDQPITVATTDGSAGWTLATLDPNSNAPALVCTISNGTVIPARGHYLIGNESGAAAVGALWPAAAFDQTYAPDLADDEGLALFRTSAPAHMTLAYRLDAVGFNNQSSTSAPLFIEGAGLAPVSANVAADEQFSYVRKLASGLPQDTGDNTQDFVLVSTTGTVAGAPAQLGAPGPENLSSPVQRNATIKGALIDRLLPSTAPPNRVRDFNVVPNGALGTLTLRRKFTNKTGAPVTALRFRIVDITTLHTPNPGGAQADLRVLDSADVVVTLSGGVQATVKGTTLEQSPTQGQGGGLNSTLTVQLPGGALAAGATVNVQFTLGVAASGNFRFLVSVEALTGTATTTPQKLAPASK